jgi:hypothetical protein
MQLQRVLKRVYPTHIYRRGPLKDEFASPCFPLLRILCLLAMSIFSLCLGLSQARLGFLDLGLILDWMVNDRMSFEDDGELDTGFVLKDEGQFGLGMGLDLYSGCQDTIADKTQFNAFQGNSWTVCPAGIQQVPFESSQERVQDNSVLEDYPSNVP